MNKIKMLFASVLLCLMLSLVSLAGDTPAGGYACPPDTACTVSTDPITNLITYFWWIVS